MAEKQSPFGVSDLLAAPVRVKKSLRDCQVPSPEPCLPGPTRPKLLRLPPMDPPDLHQPRQPHLSSGTRRCGLADVCERRAACQAYRARVAVVGERKSQYELPKTRSGLQSTLITISLAQVRRLAHFFFAHFGPVLGFSRRQIASFGCSGLVGAVGTNQAHAGGGSSQEALPLAAGGIGAAGHQHTRASARGLAPDVIPHCRCIHLVCCEVRASSRSHMGGEYRCRSSTFEREFRAGFLVAPPGLRIAD